MLRRLLAQAAYCTLERFGEDTNRWRWKMKIFERGDKNAKKRAIVAVARKLAVLLHHLWSTADVYDPLRSSTEEQAGQRHPDSRGRKDTRI